MIWNYKRTLVPLEVSLPIIPKEFHEPCTDMYNFTTALLDDMHQNSDDYDEVGNKYSEFHRWYFMWLYKKFKYYDDMFTIDKKGYKNFIKKFNPKTVETMYARHGFEFFNDGEKISISNSRYPGMMKAIFEVYSAAYMNYGVSCTGYLTVCDFRALVNYKRTYEDVWAVLDDENKKTAEQILTFADGIGVKPTKCDFFNRVEFKKKGKVVFRFNVSCQRALQVDIGFANIGGKAYIAIENEIKKGENTAVIKEFIIKNCLCRNCYPGCHGNSVEMFGKKIIICGWTPIIRVREPKEQDMEYIFQMIRLRTWLIENGISEPFISSNKS